MRNKELERMFSNKLTLFPFAYFSFFIFHFYFFSE